MEVDKLGKSQRSYPGMRGRGPATRLSRHQQSNGSAPGTLRSHASWVSSCGRDLWSTELGLRTCMLGSLSLLSRAVALEVFPGASAHLEFQLNLWLGIVCARVTEFIDGKQA